MWTAGRAGEPLSRAPLAAEAMDGGEEGKSERESLIQSRKVPSALATLAALRAKHAELAQTVIQVPWATGDATSSITSMCIA